MQKKDKGRPSNGGQRKIDEKTTGLQRTVGNKHVYYRIKIIIVQKIITRKGFEVGLEETFPSPHLVHRLHAEIVKLLKGQSRQFRKKL
jgi:hypothetical protein